MKNPTDKTDLTDFSHFSWYVQKSSIFASDLSASNETSSNTRKICANSKSEFSCRKICDNWGKGLMGAGPDLPYLNESPVYQAGSNLGSLFYEIFH